MTVEARRDHRPKADPAVDLDQIRANLALTPAERLDMLQQMDEFFLLARRAKHLGPAVPHDDSRP